MAADRIRAALNRLGYRMYIDSPTNQIFVVLTEMQKNSLTDRVEMGFMEKIPAGEYVMRFATSWVTRPEDVDALIRVLEGFAVVGR